MIEKEVNIHTVIKGYKEAFEYVAKLPLLPEIKGS
jgi:hypothetical protein